MLTQLCQYLRNWFAVNKYFGEFRIVNGILQMEYDDGNAFTALNLLPGQYYRIIGSVLNDGVHQYPNEALADETFTGAVWSMAIPAAVLALSEEISAWQCKNGGADSAAMSPFVSESFGGYSYTKAAGSSSTGSVGGWEAVYASKLTPWRKI